MLSLSYRGAVFIYGVATQLSEKLFLKLWTEFGGGGGAEVIGRSRERNA
jgi:hypothetical protein